MNQRGNFEADLRLAKALFHPLRMMLVEEAAGQLLDPEDLARRRGWPADYLKRYCEELVELGGLDAVLMRADGTIRYYATEGALELSLALQGAGWGDDR